MYNGHLKIWCTLFYLTVKYKKRLEQKKHNLKKHIENHE